MCDCIEKLEAMVAEKMVEQNTGCEVIETVHFENLSWLLEKNITILSNPVIGKYKMGNKIKKFTTKLLPTYCPFCGEKLA